MTFNNTVQFYVPGQTVPILKNNNMEQCTNDMNRQVLTAGVSSVLLGLGIRTANRDVLETLTEMLQRFLCEVGYLSKNYCELSRRTEPVIADIILGFVEMGVNVSSLGPFIKKARTRSLPKLQPRQPQTQLSMLKVGTKESLPSHIPSHFPPFPDPHTYRRTSTSAKPVSDYEAIRKQYATQKRDMKRALVKFLVKTNPVHNLFDSDETNIFSLIKCKPEFPPYASALLPQDQIFDPEVLEYIPKSQEYLAPPHKKRKVELQQQNVAPLEETEENNKQISNIRDSTLQNRFIDNPYLAATKRPFEANN